VVGFWSNAANPNEHFELRADGQFSIDENGKHLVGAWDLNGYTLTLHFSSSLVGKAQWDGQAFIDDQQKRWVRATLTSAPPTQPLTSPPVSASATPAPQGQSGDQKALLQERLNSQFKLTKTTADKNDIVTPGAVLVLQKDGLLMCSLDTPVPPTSNYKNGKISMGFGSDLAWSMQLGRNSSEVPQRKFVAGEKFWVTAFTIQEDGVIFKFYSDPYQDVRYYGQLKFPFPKHVMPPADQVLKTIAEAVTIQPDENAAVNAPQQPPPPPAQPEPVMAPIPPPPPPPDAPPAAPKTIAKGETKEQVVAILGQPTKVVNLGAKEIDIYPDMKVIFVNKKVADVQ